jgi:hypothetical protein
MKFSLLTTVSSAALGAGLIALSPVTAQAGLVCGATSCTETVYTNGGVGAITDWTSAQGTLEQISLDKFVPGLNQHLQSVVISEGGSVNSTGTVQNGAANAQTFTFGLTEKFSLMGGAGVPSNFPLANGFQIAGSKSSTYTNLAHLGTSPFTWSGTLSTYTAPTITTNLAAYVSGTASTFDLDFASNTVQNIGGGGGNINAVLNTTGIGFVSITYNFITTVTTPEPASMAILGAALIGTGVVRRRRKV